MSEIRDLPATPWIQHNDAQLYQTTMPQPGTAARDPDLADLLRILCRSFRSRSYRLYLITNDGVRLHSALGLDGDSPAGEENAAAQAYLQQTVRNRQVVVISDIANSQVIANPIKSEWLQRGYRGCVFIPCWDVAGYPVGLLELFYDNTRHIGAFDKDGLLIQGVTLAHLLQQSSRLFCLARQRDQTKQELEDFVYSVSHDLKSPIVSVQGFTALLREEAYPDLEKEHKHYFDRVVANIELIQDMVQDLLELSRVGRVNTGKSSKPLDEIVREAVSGFRDQIDHDDIRVKLPERFPAFTCKAHPLGLILGNLLDNAIKFRREGCPAVIEIGADARDELLEIHVRDNGVGIGEDDQARIFNTFYRAKDMQHIAGTGMGLAVAKKLVEDNGGQISVESQPGRGSVFTFSWPAGGTETMDAAGDNTAAQQQ